MRYEEASREEGEPEKEGWSGAQRAASASNTKLAPCVPACIHTHTHTHTHTCTNIRTYKHTVQIAIRLVFLRGCVSILHTCKNRCTENERCTGISLHKIDYTLQGIHTCEMNYTLEAYCVM